MRRQRMRMYKKKNQGLFIVFKMALICYLVIFGINYMTADTSAHFSNQSEVFQTITAGVWGNPVNQCREENAVSDDEINVDCGDEEETDRENREPKESEEKLNETDIEKDDKVDSDAGKEEEHQNLEEDDQKQPDDEDESVIKSNEKKDDEMNTVVKQEENTKKEEGDTIENEENNEVDK